MKSIRKFLAKHSTIEEFMFPSVELRKIYEVRRNHFIPIRQPLLLISQIQRSGGTMLSQMFDGHPECWTHPHEIKIGRPHKEDWPDLDLSLSPAKWFDLLFEKDTCDFFRGGFHKGNRDYAPTSLYYPFLMLPRLQKKLFLDFCRTDQPRDQRRILDHYFTAYFNSWLDCQGYYRKKARVVAFVPKLASNKDSVARFIRDYPDGKLISLVRNPSSWLASYRVSKTKHYKTGDRMLEQWVESASAMIRNKEAYPDQVLNLAFEDLLKKPLPTLEKICAFAGIAMDPAMEVPSFQTMPFNANSHFKVEATGLIQAPLERGQNLDEDDKKLVEKIALPIYEKVLPILD